MSLATLRELMGNICKSETPKGPTPAYAPAHVIKLLQILEAEETMGRITLARRIGIGEGSVRTIIKRLLEMSLISVDNVGGCHLTQKGESAVSELRKILLSSGEVELQAMGIESKAYAVHIRGIESIGSATKLRDTAVRSGAEGMIVFQVVSGKISLPSIAEDIKLDYPAVDSAIRARFHPRDGDLVLVSFSEGLLDAEAGALTVSIGLVYSLLYQ